VSEYKINHTEEEKIRALLVGRQIVKVSHDAMTLDNGTQIVVEPNAGCGGCCSGWYNIDELNRCEAVITSVRTEATDQADEHMVDMRTYRIYVLAADRESVALSVSGDDGNGYYGTGYELVVTVREEPAK